MDTLAAKLIDACERASKNDACTAYYLLGDKKAESHSAATVLLRELRTLRSCFIQAKHFSFLQAATSLRCAPASASRGKESVARGKGSTIERLRQ